VKTEKNKHMLQRISIYQVYKSTYQNAKHSIIKLTIHGPRQYYFHSLLFSSLKVIRQHCYERAHCRYNQRVEVYIARLLESL